MTIKLSDIAACLEGVIPSIIASASADGTPNISYLSHVVMVDDAHIALSNQFFAKTAANIRANPRAELLLVDGGNGAQFRLDVTFAQSVDTGPLFERIARQLLASSAQVGMADVMRLKSADIFRVDAVTEVPSPVDWAMTPSRIDAFSLATIARITKSLEMRSDAGDIIDLLLSAIVTELGYDGALVMLGHPQSDMLVTVGSIGYAASGLGSEMQIGAGLIGLAAAHGQTIKVNEMSRVRRLGAAIIEASDADENATRTITFPQMPGAQSQIAVPMITQDKMRGVLFVESRRNLAFLAEHEAALEILARQAAAALALCEMESSESAPAIAGAAAGSASRGRDIQVVHHGFDDSIFIDNNYVIKGVAGRLLAFMLERFIEEGRCDFTNREIRLFDGLRLPDVKDNLETRLLLLQRRLEEKAFPVRLTRSGRGRITLSVSGRPVLKNAD